MELRKGRIRIMGRKGLLWKREVGVSGEALKGSDGWGGKGMPKEIMAAQGSRNNHSSGDRLGGSGPSQGT